MSPRVLFGLVCVGGLVISESAFAWFIWIPIGAIEKALEIDPDSVVVSSADRALGKCAGLHVNQAQKFASQNQGYPGDRQPGAPPPETAESKFHSDMANLAVNKATDKDNVKTLAKAYSARWGRVAVADREASRTYATDLARQCVNNDIPIVLSQFAAWQAKQEEVKRVRAEEERRRVQAEEERKRARAAEEAKRGVIGSAPQDVTTRPAGLAAPVTEIDFADEARKSARILGCATRDLRVSGTDGKNILFSTVCESGQLLHLTCDQSGLCLKR